MKITPEQVEKRSWFCHDALLSLSFWQPIHFGGTLSLLVCGVCFALVRWPSLQQNPPFLIDSGRDVWAPEQVEKRSWFCHDALLSLSFWQPIHFGGTLSLLVCGVCFALVRWPSLQQNLLFLSILDATFEPQRLTLKITSAQVSEVSPAAAQIVSFLAVPAATFDTEDHPSTGRKTVSLSSPDHAVSLFRRQPFWEGFWVRSRGFAGRDIQTQPKVPTVYFEGNWRCKLHPKAAKPPFFIDSGRDVWHWRSPNAGRKTVSLSSPGHAVSLFRRQPFWEGFWVRSRGFARCDAQTQPKVPTVYFEGNWRCKLRPTAAKTFFFFRFWTRRLTLKITPAQVEKRCHWARQAMLFPCSGGSLFGKAFGSEVVVLPVVIPKRNRRCKRWISKPNRGAQWAPKLQNLLFLKILDATCDIEDHSNAGRKTVSLSSPGHAVSLFRRQPFWEGFWVRSRGFAGRDTQTQPKVPTVYFEGNWRCKLRPKAAKPPFFIDSGRDVWHWRSLQRRSKNGVLELARPCCFPVPEAAFLGRLLGQKSWFCPSWRPNATEGANGVFRRQLEAQIAPQSCKTSFFFRFWTRRLTLKITQRRSKNGVLELARPCCFPVPEAAFLGRLLGQKSWFCPLWRPNATEGANGVFRRQLEVQIAPHSCKNLLLF